MNTTTTRTPDTHSGTECMGELFDTTTDAAVFSLREWVTANGMNSTATALSFLDEGRDANLSEMAENAWVAHELVVIDWDRIAARVRAILTAESDSE